MKIRVLACAAFCSAFLSPALHAQSFRFQFVRADSLEPIPAAGLHLPAGQTARIFLRVGLYGDAKSPAPGGGLVGWQNGSISTTGGRLWRGLTGNYGRIEPFDDPAYSNDFEGVPFVNPFTSITGITGRIVTQRFEWFECDPVMPEPRIYGLRTMEQLYALRVQTFPGIQTSFQVHVSGEVLSAESWGFQRPPTQFDGPCYCPCDSPGCCDTVFYVPRLAPLISFERTLHVSTGPVCAGDWDRSGAVNSTDFFAFLDDFFSGAADFDGDGASDSADFFAFVNEFFAGCG